MIVTGESRCNGASFARHLMRTDHNERVTIKEMRGFAYAEDVPTAFRELKEMAEGTRCQNYFYHATLNPKEHEHLTDEQWAEAVDILERQLGLEGQTRFVMAHDKEGRAHQHVIWSRIDQDTRTAISDSLTFQRHERAAREIEEAFGLEPVPSTLVKDRSHPRPERRPKDWESFRAQESKIDPKAMKAELTDLWQRADSGPAFAAALEERGYILARGDRRDFCVIDRAGDEHSLGRRISGVKAAEIRSRMADVDPLRLPSVEEGRALAKQRQDAEGSAAPASADEQKPEAAPSPFEAIKATLASQEPQAEAAPVTPKELPTAAPFEAIRARCAQEDAAAPRMPEERDDTPASRFDRFRAWCGTMREYVADFGQQVRDYWGEWFRGHSIEPEEPPPMAAAAPTTPTHGAPGSTVSAPTLQTPTTQKPQHGLEPDL